MKSAVSVAECHVAIAPAARRPRDAAQNAWTAGRRAAIGGHVNQHVSNVVDRRPRAKCRLRINLDLVEATQPCEDAKRDEGPSSVMESRARPGLRPDLGRHELLKGPRQLVSSSQACIDVVVPRISRRRRSPISGSAIPTSSHSGRPPRSASANVT